MESSVELKVLPQQSLKGVLQLKDRVMPTINRWQRMILCFYEAGKDGIDQEMVVHMMADFVALDRKGKSLVYSFADHKMGKDDAIAMFVAHPVRPEWGEGAEDDEEEEEEEKKQPLGSLLNSFLGKVAPGPAAGETRRRATPRGIGGIAAVLPCGDRGGLRHRTSRGRSTGGPEGRLEMDRSPGGTAGEVSVDGPRGARPEAWWRRGRADAQRDDPNCHFLCREATGLGLGPGSEWELVAIRW